MQSVEITQTSFLDFCTATPRGKVGVVREVRTRYEQDYRDWRDAYRPVREGIKTLHRKGKERNELAKFVGNVHPDVAKHIDACIMGYERWMGRKRFSWVSSPRSARWKSGRLMVKVNPELKVFVNDELHVVKLYFKDRPLTKTLLDTQLHLLKANFSDEETRVGVLDVRQSKLIVPTTSPKDIELRLAGEAAHFLTIWEGLGSSEAA